MINIGKILKRSWHILWSYRVLWIFGILLALTTGTSSSSRGSSSNRPTSTTGGFPGTLPAGTPPWVQQLSQWFVQNVEPLFTHPAEHVGTFVMIGVILLLVILFFSVLAALVRYPAETAVIRMVDEYEQTGARLKFKQGWKLGWTRRAFRLWLIDLILSIPVLLFVLLILAAGLIVLFGVASPIHAVQGIGVVAAIGLGFLCLFILIVAAVFIGLLRNFFARFAVLEDMGVKESLQHGWAMFKRNLKSVGLVWLVMVGIAIAFGIIGLIAFFLLIPAYLILLVPAAIVAAVPALIGFGITSIFTSSPLTWIIAILAAVPFFFMILFAPLLLVDGWYKIYSSNVWTLTYREIKAMENLTAPALPGEDMDKDPVS